jgi:putative membrane protein
VTVPEGEIDYRFTLANERTFLAWVRTALALVAGGIAAAKALEFNHDVYRWIVAAPPIAGGALLALEATFRRRTYQDAMRAGAALPGSAGLRALGGGLCIYALIALVAIALDG